MAARVCSGESRIFISAPQFTCPCKLEHSNSQANTHRALRGHCAALSVPVDKARQNRDESRSIVFWRNDLVTIIMLGLCGASAPENLLVRLTLGGRSCQSFFS